MRSQFQLGESIRYYMAEENIERIMQHDYHPNSVNESLPFQNPNRMISPTSYGRVDEPMSSPKPK